MATPPILPTTTVLPMRASRPSISHKSSAKRSAGGTSTARRTDRQGKQIIAGHFDIDTAFAVKELLGRMGRQTGHRVTVQDVLGMGLALMFRRYHMEPPAELKSPPSCRRSKSDEPSPSG
jgi:hypothetical protein